MNLEIFSAGVWKKQKAYPLLGGGTAKEREGKGRAGGKGVKRTNKDGKKRTKSCPCLLHNQKIPVLQQKFSRVCGQDKADACVQRSISWCVGKRGYDCFHVVATTLRFGNRTAHLLETDG